MCPFICGVGVRAGARAPGAPGRNNIEFDLDLKLNLIYDLIFWKKFFSPNVQRGVHVGSQFSLCKLQ